MGWNKLPVTLSQALIDEEFKCGEFYVMSQCENIIYQTLPFTTC